MLEVWPGGGEEQGNEGQGGQKKIISVKVKKKTNRGYFRLQLQVHEMLVKLDISGCNCKFAKC